MRSSILILPTLIVAANAATITNYTDIFAPTASIQYQLTVNGGGNTGSSGFINGSDPTILTRSAVTANITDGLILDGAELYLTLTPGILNSSRDASTFIGVTSTWNPTFGAPHTTNYTVNVSSSAGSNSYVSNGSTSDLDVLGLLNFAALLDVSATNRQILVSWQDSIDFSASAMPRDSFGRTAATYRWNLSSAVSGATDLQLTTSTLPPPPPEVPEPSTLLLLGSSLTSVAAVRLRKKK